MTDYEKLKIVFKEIDLHFIDEISKRHSDAKRSVRVIRIRCARFYFDDNGKFTYLDDETDGEQL